MSRGTPPAFGCEILGYDPWLEDAGAVAALGVEPVGVVDLRALPHRRLSPVTTENVGAIGRGCFEVMKWGSVVVRVSRAAVVDGRRFSTATASGSHPRGDRRLSRGAITAERVRTTPGGTILPPTGQATCPRSGAASERWWQTTSRPCSLDAHRGECSGRPCDCRKASLTSDRRRARGTGGCRTRRMSPIPTARRATSWTRAALRRASSGFFGAGFFAAGPWCRFRQQAWRVQQRRRSCRRSWRRRRASEPTLPLSSLRPCSSYA